MEQWAIFWGWIGEVKVVIFSFITFSYYYRCIKNMASKIGLSVCLYGLEKGTCHYFKILIKNDAPEQLHNYNQPGRNGNICLPGMIYYYTKVNWNKQSITISNFPQKSLAGK